MSSCNSTENPAAEPHPSAPLGFSGLIIRAHAENAEVAPSEASVRVTRPGVHARAVSMAAERTQLLYLKDLIEQRLKEIDRVHKTGEKYAVRRAAGLAAVRKLVLEHARMHPDARPLMVKQIKRQLPHLGVSAIFRYRRAVWREVMRHRPVPNGRLASAAVGRLLSDAATRPESTMEPHQRASALQAAHTDCPAAAYAHYLASCAGGAP